MALRLIEKVLQEKDGAEVRELIEEHKVLEHRQIRLPDGEVLVSTGQGGGMMGNDHGGGMMGSGWGWGMNHGWFLWIIITILVIFGIVYMMKRK